MESFRNIDLFNQGVYFIRVSIFNEIDKERYYAHPYNVSSCADRSDTQARKKQKESFHHNVIGARSDEETATFCSRAFMIRYSEEKVEINDFAHFRTEIDVVPGYLDTKFYLQAELMFSDLMTLGGPDKWHRSP